MGGIPYSGAQQRALVRLRVEDFFGAGVIRRRRG